jgi:hypothetical protein
MANAAPSDRRVTYMMYFEPVEMMDSATYRELARRSAAVNGSAR